MKTNHGRGYKDPGSFRFPDGVYTRKLTGKVVRTKPVYGKNTPYGGNRATQGQKSAAKKFLRAQERLDGKKLCKIEPE